MIRKYPTYAVSMLLGAGLLWLAGCGQKRGTEQSAATTDSMPASDKLATDSAANSGATTPDEEHGHVPGAHGGIIVSLGRDSYHVEAVFEQGGKLRLYMLGSDETRIQEVERQELTGYAKASDSTESQSFKLTPEPQEGDAEGKTSMFVAELPEDLAGGGLDVTVPSIRIAGERFRLGFTSTPQSHGDDVMPEKVADEAERELYLTAGGIYTEEDIKGNGNMTASQKFKGFRAKHDMHPKPGDTICPVTMTLGNPECTWIIAGKEYEFCCPPCVDEFVAMAKDEETAKDILDPSEYVKK
jgi:hypothetical protein